MMEDKIQKKIDWFLNYSKENQVTILLILIILFSYWNGIKLEEKFDAKIEIYKEAIENCKENQIELRDMNIELEKRINQLVSEIVIFKASGDNSPLPEWIKSDDGKFLWVSKAFTRRYLRPLNLTSDDILGHYESEFVVDTLEIDTYRRQDSLVLARNMPITFKHVSILGYDIEILKYPYRVGQEVIGVAGIEYIEFK